MNTDKPFFIEATSETIDAKLVDAGIYGGKKLPPPYVGVSKDGKIWEMFMRIEGKKTGYMVHPTGQKIKADLIHKYVSC